MLAPTGGSKLPRAPRERGGRPTPRRGLGVGGSTEGRGRHVSLAVGSSGWGPGGLPPIQPGRASPGARPPPRPPAAPPRLAYPGCTAAPRQTRGASWQAPWGAPRRRGWAWGSPAPPARRRGAYRRPSSSSAPRRGPRPPGRCRRWRNSTGRRGWRWGESGQRGLAAATAAGVGSRASSSCGAASHRPNPPFCGSAHRMSKGAPRSRLFSKMRPVGSIAT
jgi:hypothetical protein